MGSFREIPLTKGYVALVDAADFDWLTQWKWSAGGGGRLYARRRATVEGVSRTIAMHRVIAAPPAGMLVDHANGDTMDNRRANLRICTRADNNRNSVKRRHGRWPYKGIHQTKYGRFQALIRVDGVGKHLGCYATVEECARAYDRAALLYFGEFARLNFPEDA